MSKVNTISFGSVKAYAKVADRLKVFWEENPNGKIDVEREELADSKIRFIARIWRDSGELLKLAQAGTSAEVIKMTANATASADAAKKGDKENEKLETVAVGRALAMLGYLASGDVASREEMEEFEHYKEQRRLEAAQNAIDSIEACRSIDELKAYWLTLGILMNDKRVLSAKEAMKSKLSAKEAK